MNNLRGGALWIVVVIALFIGLSVIFFLKFKNFSDDTTKITPVSSQPSSNTQNSKSVIASSNPQSAQNASTLIEYKNPTRGYSFKYPKTIGGKEIFFLNEANSEEITDFSRPIPVDVAPRHIYITLKENPEKLILKEYIDGIFMEKNTIPPGGGEMISYSDQPDLMANIIRKPTKVDNIDAEILIGLPSAYGQYEVTAPLGNDKFISFILTPYDQTSNDPEDKKWVEAFEQILSAFKFNR